MAKFDVCRSTVCLPEIILFVLLSPPVIYDFYGIHIHAQIVKIREYSNKYTILQYNSFTIKTLELQHILTLYGGSSSGNVPHYLYKT